ncbi:hypothetical protein J5J10_14435 [Ciceribacter sp. L1K23]|uniref:hypothetical protein n=1 Tax=Ciceribacter sp. L1K23 TaxID=2820276 RepID=UPI001B81DD2C|nr:hypothetical protein [Ciceribacter sp. L1K23]MBR0556882.1 hypothetical protein [Ciceribacter sp. L1K23]
MRHQIVATTFFLLATASVSYAADCNTPVISIDANGRAEFISPERDVTRDMESFFGEAPGPDVILVVDARARQGTWIARTELPGVLAGFGATSDGFLYSGPSHCLPPGLPVDLPENNRQPEELPPGKPPIDLFPGVEPQSGLWQVRLGDTRLEGCPPLMQQVFPKSAGALPAEWLAPRRLDFEAPFHPDQLEMSRKLAAEGLSQIDWRAAGEDAWQAEIFSNLFGQIPAGQGAGSKMTWRLTLKSETEIEHVATVHIVLPIEASAVLGGSENCRMVSRNQWVRVSD